METPREVGIFPVVTLDAGQEDDSIFTSMALMILQFCEQD